MTRLLRRVGVVKVQCAHRDAIRDIEISGTGCPQCLAVGDTWVHLRICMTCGQMGCCDASKNKHARKHAGTSDHPIVRSLEPGESWMWCFIDEGFLKSHA